MFFTFGHFTMTTILDEHFSTQKELQERLQSLLKNKTDILIPKNQAFAVEIVQRYNKVYEVGEPVERVYVDVNSATAFPNLCMHVVFNNQTTLTVSYKFVARAAMSAENADAVAVRRLIDIKLASLRTAVHPDIQQFKATAFQQGRPQCALCHKCLVTGKHTDVHVDHYGPNTEFRHLVQLFQRQQQTAMVDMDEAAFVVFHQRHAMLQLLCAHCNVTKKRPTLTC